MAQIALVSTPEPPRTMTREIADKLRRQFPPEQIGKLPRGNIVLDYVGHADTTSRLLEADPEWNWEPLAYDEHGLPLFDVTDNGRPVGLWIKLTVAGVTRLGYGSVPANQNDAVKVLIGDCLLRGTPIMTRRGEIPVEDVRIGDSVPTRAGWRRVTDHWLSHYSAPVMSVLLADGRVIVGTPHHKVPTADRGLQPIMALRNGDMLFAWQDTGDSPGRMTSPGTGAFTDGTQITRTGTAAFTSWQRQRREDIFTSISTRRNTAPFLTDGTSTIATAIRSIMTLPISQRSLQGNMLAGMVSTGSLSHGSAMSAASLTMQERAGAAGALPPARNAARITSQSGPGRDSAQVAVVAVLGAGTGEVWNLSVDGIHEYAANGIFVSNSLRNAAMRFGVALDLWAKGDRADPAAENPSGSAGHAARSPKGRAQKPERMPVPAQYSDADPAAAQELAELAKLASTVEELRGVWKSAGATGALPGGIAIPGSGEKMTLQEYLYRRSDELSHSKSAGTAEKGPGGDGDPR